MYDFIDIDSFLLRKQQRHLSLYKLNNSVENPSSIINNICSFFLSSHSSTLYLGEFLKVVNDYLNARYSVLLDDVYYIFENHPLSDLSDYQLVEVKENIRDIYEEKYVDFKDLLDCFLLEYSYLLEEIGIDYSHLHNLNQVELLSYLENIDKLYCSNDFSFEDMYICMLSDFTYKALEDGFTFLFSSIGLDSILHSYYINNNINILDSKIIKPLLLLALNTKTMYSTYEYEITYSTIFKSIESLNYGYGYYVLVINIFKADFDLYSPELYDSYSNEVSDDIKSFIKDLSYTLNILEKA